MYLELTPEPTPLLARADSALPRCGKSYHAGWLQKRIAFLACQNREQRWWAMLLARGHVVPQFAQEFEDAMIAHVLVETYHMSHELQERRFW